MKKYRELLIEANEIIRSFNSVIERQGRDTNWEALNITVKKILAEQHSILYTNKNDNNSALEWYSVLETLPSESNRYWCYVEEQNSLGKSNFQWNCYYDKDKNTWSDNLTAMHVTHWTTLLDKP